MNASDKPKGKGALGFALDFGPLLLFFLANHFLSSKTDPAHGPLAGTAVFMVAIVAAIIISRVKFGKVSPMMWVSAILVVGFGGITLWLGDPKFIQIKPTIIYVLFGSILVGGWVRGKALLKFVFEYAFDGVDENGWLKLSRNWGLFFFAMAVTNEIIRLPQWFSFDTWLTMKVWGVTGLSLLFTMSQMPMLLKHGLKLGDAEDGAPK
jgi:intracellular septation protein